MVYRLYRVQRIPRPRAEVAEFFENPSNLEQITPPFLNFRILTPQPVTMKEGALIDYSLRLFGVPMRWRTRIEEYVPHERFIDLQLRGPYRLWHHTHTFSDVPGGTEMTDLVQYELPLGPLGNAVHAVVVKRQLETIFSYRYETVSRIFA